MNYQIVQLTYFKNKYGTNIKNNWPIYICKFSFSNPIYWLKILDEFNINYDNNEEEHFKQNFTYTPGITVPIGNAILLCLNTDNNIDFNTIYHELFHCLQLILDLKINIKNLAIDKIKNGIYQLGLSSDDIEYLTNPKEFQTYITLEFNNILEHIYTEFYSQKINLKQFKLNVIIDLENNINNIFLSKFYQKFIQSKSILNKDNIVIKCFAMYLYLDDKTYLQEAIKMLF